jgi:hypothetical protein
MGRDLMAQDGYIAYFNTIHGRWFLPTEEDLAKEINLEPVARFDDGTLYRVTP